jgi:hypothetical protein
MELSGIDSLVNFHIPRAGRILGRCVVVAGVCGGVYVFYSYRLILLA